MQKSDIEWTDYTWNPVTGCYHGCSYCYARAIAHRFASDSGRRWEAALATEPKEGQPKALAEAKQGDGAFPFGFVPTLYPHRLHQPNRDQKPARVFVCSMADLFGEWVPQAWIEGVLRVADQCPQHTFLFLTKNPKRYADVCFGPNCWVGCTAEDQAAADERLPHLLEVSAPVRFLSAEPLLGRLNLAPWLGVRGLEWVIVGRQTGPGAGPINEVWVADIVGRATMAGVPVFLKDNLKWPGNLRKMPKVGMGGESRGTGRA